MENELNMDNKENTTWLIMSENFRNVTESLEQNATSTAWEGFNTTDISNNHTSLTTLRPNFHLFFPTWCSLFNFLITGLLSGMVCIFGIIGNLLTQVTLWAEVRKNSTSLLVIVLAALDNLVLFTIFIGEAVTNICTYFAVAKTFERNMTWIMIAYGWIFTTLMQAISAYVIVLISFCRYIALCRPHDVTRYTAIGKMQKIVVIIVLAVTLFFIPKFCRVQLVYNSNLQRYSYRALDFSNSLAYKIYDIPVYYILMYLIPSSLLVAMTVLQVRELSRIRKKREQISKKVKDQNEITNSLIFVVVFFLVFLLGEPIRLIIFEIDQDRMNAIICKGKVFHASLIRMFFAVMNSSVNFLIYFVGVRGFRRKLRQKVLRSNSVAPSSSYVAE